MKKYCICAEVVDLEGTWLGDGWCSTEFPYIPSDGEIRNCIDNFKQGWANRLSLHPSKFRLKLLSISYLGES